MKCPYCKIASLPSVPYKEWNYRKEYYRVKAFECPNCGRKVMQYYHGKELRFTLPKPHS